MVFGRGRKWERTFGGRVATPPFFVSCRRGIFFCIWVGRAGTPLPLSGILSGGSLIFAFSLRFHCIFTAFCPRSSLRFHCVSPCRGRFGGVFPSVGGGAGQMVGRDAFGGKFACFSPVVYRGRAFIGAGAVSFVFLLRFAPSGEADKFRSVFSCLLWAVSSVVSVSPPCIFLTQIFCTRPILLLSLHRKK